MTGLLASLVTSAVVSATPPSAVFVAETFAAVERLDAAIPALTASAEQAAERIWRNPHASIEVPRKPQWGFAEKLWERAGGLAQIADGRELTPAKRDLIAPFRIFGMTERDYAVLAERGLYGRMDPETGRTLTERLSPEYPDEEGLTKQ